ncbi:MAG: tetratricopeptide repeat protein, partial [Myxococcota bacterium]
ASIQAFADQQLESEGIARDALDHRLASWAVPEAERQAKRVHGPQGERALDWLVRERDNLMAVVHSALSKGLRSIALRALVALSPWVTTHGPYTQHLDLLTQAMSLAGEVDAPLQAQALEVRGNLRRQRGQLDEALVDLRQALDLARQCGDRSTEGSVVANLGIAAHERGLLDEAQQLHAEARAIWAELGDRRREGRALGSLAILHQEQGRLDEAERCYQQALLIFRDEMDRRSEGIFLINLGELYKEQRHLPLARHHYTQALTIVRDLGDRRLEAVVLGNLGGLDQEEERLDEAQELREQAVILLREVGDRRLEGVFTGYLGALHHTRGRPAKARDLYRDAIARLSEAGDRRFEGIFWGYLGAAEASLDRLDAAQEAFTQAEQRLGELGDTLLLTALALHRVHLPLTEARNHESQGQADEATQERDRARSMMADALRSPPIEGRSEHPDATPAARSDEVRFALRLLEQRLEVLSDDIPVPEVPGVSTAVSSAPEGALLVSKDGRAFQLPDGESVSLGRRRAPRRILQRLVEHRQSEDDENLSVYDLMEAGWPGEKLHPEAGTNRVYVAVTTLRNLGLRDLLVYRDEGYLLDPSVPVVVVPREQLEP